jgi:heptaprenyl diphosphate synthase
MNATRNSPQSSRLVTSCRSCRSAIALTLACLVPSALAEGIEPASKGQTVYVPIYSEIRHANVASSGRIDSTLMSVLVSVRNTDPKNAIRIVAAPYYNTDGGLVRNSVPKPRVIPPFGTFELFRRTARERRGVPVPTMRSSGKPRSRTHWFRRRQSRPSIRGSRRAIRSPSFRAAGRYRNLDAAAPAAPATPLPAITLMPDAKQLVKLTTTPEDHRIAQLAAAAIGLSLIDAAIPLPLPGIKPGLANIVTLIVLARYGWIAAAWVSGLRIFAGSLLLGYFLSPGFFMSLTGALFSLLTLALAIRLPRRYFGPVSWSVLAAFAHIGGQLLLARWWLIPHDGLFLLLPFFAVAALVFGIINGLIAARLLEELPATESEIENA